MWQKACLWIAGGGNRLRQGQHINIPEGTLLANLWLTQTNLLGLNLPRFADSTGIILALFAQLFPFAVCSFPKKPGSNG
ncbi:MAG TPA: hypothetical protein DD473_27580 [Planctomycetaceae bacterium]|nr:hypothetical protein [Planctomycetaceae bacterium]